MQLPVHHLNKCIVSKKNHMSYLISLETVVQLCFYDFIAEEKVIKTDFGIL